MKSNSESGGFCSLIAVTALALVLFFVLRALGAI